MAKKPMPSKAMKAKMKADDAFDKKKGIKERSKADRAVDKKRGIPRKYS